MMQFVIAAPRSGSGKTTVTCALLAALKKRGMDPCAFKSGPDYIDPMFHRSVLGVESHNLDLYLSAKNTVRELYAHYAAGHGAVVCEGAMGFYDGQGLTTRASAWELADALDLPVLLVVQPKGASVTLAAEIQGLVHFKPESHIAGILLNDCSEKLFRMLKPLLETETGLPVLGYLPRLPQAVVESRHLGLKTAGEITDLAQKIGLLADALEANLDWATLEALTERPAPAPAPPPAPEDICGLYLPGGYPELYARPLSENKTMRDAIRDAVNGGLPTVAECGGFLYLGQTLEDASGTAWPMAGVLPGKGVKVGRLVRFGYADMTAKADSLLFHAGEHLYIHEFHHWDSTDNGSGFSVWKSEKVQWECGFASMSLYAGFPHLYWAGTPLPRRFVSGAKFYQRQKRNTHD